jgi:hypothetical protein
VQANPAGIVAAETSSFRKLRPPVKLTQVFELMGMVAHPLTPLTSLHTLTVFPTS